MFDSSTLQNGFRVRYLGCTSFGHGKRQVGISILQRPLLELYSAARRRGEDQRSAHPLALTQNLDVSDYGLVVADSEVDRRSGDTVPVVTKVITPLSNIILWASVRFNSRIIKRKTFGAAFVPIACSEAVVDPKSYVQLSSKQRFLVSLTHPSVFACLLRSVATPKLLECHAFVCATAEDAITLCSHLGTAKDDGMPISTSVPRVIPIVNRNEDGAIPWTEEESDITIPSEMAPLPPRPSYLSVHNNNDRNENRNRRRENNIRENDTKKLTRYNQNGHIQNYESRKPAPSHNSKVTKRYNDNGIKRGPSFKSLSSRRNVISLKVSSPTVIRSSKMSNTSRTNSEVGSSLARIDERWEPFWNPYRSDYRASGFSKTPSTSGVSAFSDHRTRKKTKDMATMTDDYLWTDASSWLPSDGPESWISSPTNTSDSAVVKSPSPRRILEEMTQTRTMVFSSESEESSLEEPWHRKLPDKERNSGVKLTYFGYECYRPTPSAESDIISNNSRINKLRRTKETSAKLRANQPKDVVHNNRISIDVTYPSQRLNTPDSSIYMVPNPKTTCHIPHGIRSYNKSGSVKNWSNLSQVSDSSYKRAATLPNPKNPKVNGTKMIRWSSEERVKGKYNFLTTIKRISQSSFRKAKRRTGKLIESFRNRVKDGKKSKKKNGIDYSEDSAYETSEICLSPQGHHHHQSDADMKKRQMSWSFQDLRLASSPVKDKTYHRPSSPAGSALGGSTARQLVMKKKRRKRRRKSGIMRGHSSSDSGVEEYHSDYSEAMNNNKSELEMKQFANQVTRIRVKHGINKEGFHRWSQTDLREELGYIP